MSNSGPWLVMDAGSPRAVVGVCNQGATLSEVFLDGHRKHAESLTKGLSQALENAHLEISDLAGIAVGQGPGSFVGVRVAISTAKGIALATGLPLIGFCPLLALAHHPDLPSGMGLAVLDARKGELYYRQVNRENGRAVACADQGAATPDAISSLFPRIDFLTGYGTDLFTESWIGGCQENRTAAGPCMSGISILLQHMERPDNQLMSLVPNYWRAPDAKLPKSQPKMAP
jgi:tRNA threonylcarbamoyladenosine biosynthesis protein TsaB